MSISIDMARRIVEACKRHARELRSPVSIAVVDAGGHLVLFERMMAPYGWITGDISIAKASTAVMFNQPTDAVAQWGAGIPGFASSLSSITNGKFIMAAGGWPIRINGVTVGGVGVSGGNAPGRDDEIARAGLAAIDAVQAVPAQQPIPQASYQGGYVSQPVASYPPYPQSVPVAQQQARPKEESSVKNKTPQYTRQLPPDQEISYNQSEYVQSPEESSGDQS